MNHDEKPENQTTYVDITLQNVSFLSFFGIIVPTWDQYSDHYLTEKLLNEKEERERRFGFLMLAVILLVTIFTIRQWWIGEKGWKNRLITLPFVLLQMYPQYRAGRIIYLGLQKKMSWKYLGHQKKEISWKDEDEIFERDIVPLGKPWTS